MERAITLGMDDHHDDGSQQPDTDDPLLSIGLSIILEQHERTTKDLLCIPEVKAMLDQILSALAFVPDQLHELARHTIACLTFWQSIIIRISASRAAVPCPVKRVPSMQAERGKTARVFHAKDDVPEVRREVFKLVARFDLRFYGVVRHKTALLDYVRQRNEREADYRYRGDEIYDTLVEELFRRYHPRADRLEICFATRGNKARTHAFRAAIAKAEARFESQHGMRRSAEVAIIASTPPQKAGLQAVDYFLWALQRHYERDESRYLELVWNQVVEIEDLDRIDGSRKGVVYNRKRPLIVDQEAPE